MRKQFDGGKTEGRRLHKGPNRVLQDNIEKEREEKEWEGRDWISTNVGLLGRQAVNF